MLPHCHGITGSVMHLVSAGSPHLNISQSAPVTAQNTANTNTATSSTLSINRVSYSAPTQGLAWLELSSLFLGVYIYANKNLFFTYDFFNAFIRSPLHGEQPWHREDCCASNSRQGRWACAHTGSGPLPSCNSPSIPVSLPTPKYDTCEKHCSNPDCPTHHWSCYCPLHHSSSWKP